MALPVSHAGVGKIALVPPCGLTGSCWHEKASNVRCIKVQKDGPRYSAILALGILQINNGLYFSPSKREKKGSMSSISQGLTVDNFGRFIQACTEVVHGL